jgi:hypothetical protein
MIFLSPTPSKVAVTKVTVVLYDEIRIPVKVVRDHLARPWDQIVWHDSYVMLSSSNSDKNAPDLRRKLVM